MTEIMGKLPAAQNLKQSKFQQTMQSLLSLNQNYIKQSANKYCFLQELESIPTQSSQILTKYHFLVAISLQNQCMEICINLYDEYFMSISAKTQYHKIALIKAASIINRYLQTFTLKINPLSGSIKLCAALLLLENFNEKQIITKFFDEISSQALLAVVRIQQILESRDTQNNIFMRILNCNMLKNYGPDAVYLQQQDQLTEQSEHCELHEKHFFQSSPNLVKLPIFPQFCDNNQFLLAKETVINYQLSKLIKSKAMIHKTNLAKLELTKQIDNKLKEQEVGKKIGNAKIKRWFIWSNIQAQKNQIGDKQNKLKIQMKTLSQVKQEYRICAKFAQKDYFTFLKQYIIFQSESKFPNFIFTKEEESSLSLLNFLNKNSLVISFETRLFYATQILGIAFTLLRVLKKSVPMLIKENIMVSKQLFRLEALHYPAKDFMKQLSEIIFLLFFGEDILIMHQQKSESKVDKYCANGSEQCYKYGPTAFISWIRKILLDYISKQVHEGSPKMPLQDILCTFSRMQEFINKNEGIYDINEDYSYPPYLWFQGLV